MNKELIDSLKERFYFLSELSYISCGDGWYKIISDLSDKILDMIPPESFKVVQIKEKFGGLRYYFELDQKYGHVNHPYMMHEEDLESFNKRTEFIQKLSIVVMDAESNSYITCERCGKPASSVVHNLYVQTLCDEHNCCRSI